LLELVWLNLFGVLLFVNIANAEEMAHTAELLATVRKIATPGKGILAADESTSTAGKRLTGIGLPNTEDNRRSLREFLFTAPDIEKHISGVILYEETLYQKTAAGDGTLTQILQSRGIVPGIKVDVGVAPLPGSPKETFTQGLDGLKARCEKYYAAGARFAKWRAVINIEGELLPSAASIAANADGLAKYAAICQSAGLVPIVEPEVLSDGSHDIARCERVTRKVLAQVFAALAEADVLLEGIILKPNMVLPGASAPAVPPQEAAAATLRVLQQTVPPAVPTIMFLSGGQSEEDATQHLALMNQLPGPKPWYLSFSYGRALQQSALKAWGGQSGNVAKAQAAFAARAAANGAAALGTGCNAA